jgi:hypothetical protein
LRPSSISFSWPFFRRDALEKQAEGLREAQLAESGGAQSVVNRHSFQMRARRGNFLGRGRAFVLGFRLFRLG